ncbi:MAG: hypothetical protein IJI51_08865 [Lachnospiraceae bacterium]|nr:hypothetical protein [Lachnospiraceae bacterium]
MLNYSVKLDSVKDLIELKKIADRYGISGKINQNGFHGDMRSVLTNIFYLPLDEANVEIDDGYMESQVSYITEAMGKLSA